MEKRVSVKILVATAIALTGVTTASLADTAKTSPFSDSLTVQLQGFPLGAAVNNYYTSNNGVNITGKSYVNIDQYSADNVVPITIWSNNKAANGYPVMKFSYITNADMQQTCSITFVDGPWDVLNYESQPTCSLDPTLDNVTFGSIKMKSRHNYTAIITDNEPS